jgi:SAM-dependent methyltransferase/uncharacterized protein YbaR (Trm112 family)
MAGRSAGLYTLCGNAVNRDSDASYTEATRRWLEDRFHAADGELYRSHQPIYGIGEHDELTESNHLWRAAKTVQLMRMLARVEGSTLLDVGAAEGYTSKLARDLFGYDVTVSDVSLEAMLRARDLFALPGTSVNASNLPFRDGSFDVVLCSECIEHLEHPYEMILDAARVARRCLIIATVESRATYWAARLQLCRLPVDEPHGHRSAWCREDFVRMLGPGVITCSESAEQPWTRGATPFDTLKSVTVPPPPPHHGEGIIMLCFFDPGASRATPRLEDDEIIRRVLEFRVEARPVSVPPDDTPVPRSLGSSLQCPMCRRAALSAGSGILTCSGCGQVYRVKGGVPDLFVPQPAPLSELVRLGKPDGHPSATRRMGWARKRSEQFDREPRMRSPRGLLLVGRLIRFLEHLDAQPGWGGKAVFLLGKVLPFLRRRVV